MSAEQIQQPKIQKRALVELDLASEDDNEDPQLDNILSLINASLEPQTKKPTPLDFKRRLDSMTTPSTIYDLLDDDFLDNLRKEDDIEEQRRKDHSEETQRILAEEEERSRPRKPPRLSHFFVQRKDPSPIDPLARIRSLTRPSLNGKELLSEALEYDLVKRKLPRRRSSTKRDTSWQSDMSHCLKEIGLHPALELATRQKNWHVERIEDLMPLSPSSIASGQRVTIQQHVTAIECLAEAISRQEVINEKHAKRLVGILFALQLDESVAFSCLHHLTRITSSLLDEWCFFGVEKILRAVEAFMIITSSPEHFYRLTSRVLIMPVEVPRTWLLFIQVLATVLFTSFTRRFELPSIFLDLDLREIKIDRKDPTIWKYEEILKELQYMQKHKLKLLDLAYEQDKIGDLEHYLPKGKYMYVEEVERQTEYDNIKDRVLNHSVSADFLKCKFHCLDVLLLQMTSNYKKLLTGQNLRRIEGIVSILSELFTSYIPENIPYDLDSLLAFLLVRGQIMNIKNKLQDYTKYKNFDSFRDFE